MKTLLVSFQNNLDIIGIKYIRAYLLSKNIDSQIMLIPQMSPNDIAAVLDHFKIDKPDIIGISLMSCEFDNAKEFTSAVKKIFPEIVVVWGGIHPTVAPQESLENSDYIFVGESEIAFFEFLEAYELGKPVNNILNLGYHLNGKKVINELRPLNDDLDSLPFPEPFPSECLVTEKGRVRPLDRSLFKGYSKFSGRFISLTTTRGCQFSCSYCCNSVFSKLYGDIKIRKRSVDNVIAELKRIINVFPDLIFVNIQDDNFFSYDIDWINEFSKRFRDEIGKKFVCRTTPAHLNEEKLKCLKAAGLAWVFMGLQSGSARVNKNIYKRFVTNDKFIDAATIIKKHDIAGHYDIIMDNPYETEEDLIHTVETLLRIPRPFMLQIFSLCFYQGTEIDEQRSKDGLKSEDPKKKNYFKYMPTYMNRTIRLSAVLPGAAVKFLVSKRNSWPGAFALNLLYAPSVLILETLIWLRLILLSLDYRPLAAIAMILSFGKTALNKIILRK